MQDTRMSDTPQPTAESIWGAPAMAIFSLALLLCSLVFAYFSKNENMMLLIVGIIGSNATTAVGYYLGSSRSSQLKDQIISAQLPPVKGP